MSQEPHWKELTLCNSGIEAEMLAEFLREEGIPTLVQSPVAGVYGFGFGGPTPQGVTISVPSDRLEEAKRILEENPRV